VSVLRWGGEGSPIEVCWCSLTGVEVYMGHCTDGTDTDADTTRQRPWPHSVHGVWRVGARLPSSSRRHRRRHLHHFHHLHPRRVRDHGLRHRGPRGRGRPRRPRRRYIRRARSGPCTASGSWAWACRRGCARGRTACLGSGESGETHGWGWASRVWWVLVLLLVLRGRGLIEARLYPLDRPRRYCDTARRRWLPATEDSQKKHPLPGCARVRSTGLA
jgi:hypothetical protein